jgi:hypothetical protein
LKLNIIGIVGGILAFVSLALPWWTLSFGYSGTSLDVSIYPYMAVDVGAGISLWYGWVALALIIVGGLLGIVGSLTPGKAKMLSIGGALALVSIIIFAVGLQLDFLSIPSTEGSPTFALFMLPTSVSSSGYDMSYFAYLSFGFWIALVAAILMFAASRKKPAQIAGYPPPPPPPAAY